LTIFIEKEAVWRIRIDLNTAPDPAFYVNTDPDLDSDPGFFQDKNSRNFAFQK